MLLLKNQFILYIVNFFTGDNAPGKDDLLDVQSSCGISYMVSRDCSDTDTSNNKEIGESVGLQFI